MTLSPGTRIRRYEVRAVLGVGGMGEVYLARDVELDRLVALKILPRSGDAHDEERIHRFLQEAKAAIALSHPNVAHIYDAGDENGVRFMAMEYVQGETLRARIARGRLSLEEAIDITLQVASALANAHAAGIVHRDIKPENVMLRPDGYVKVLDFGLAKLTVRDRVPDATEVVHTAPGVVMGTMHYMSPEQLRGGHVDARTDVFSLGVMLYELAGGHRPFEASTASGVIAAILTEEPKPLEGVPAELSEVIAKALAKDPDARFASARELTEALKKLRGQSHGIRSGDIPTQVITHPVEASRRRRWSTGVIALLLAALLGAAWLVVRQRKIAGARATLPRIEQLAEQSRFFEAWDLAKSAQAVLGADERLTRAMQSISSELNVKTDPAGAQVILQRVLADGTTTPREIVGTTPLAKHAIPNGDYILAIEKDGYAAIERLLSTTPFRVSPQSIVQQPAPAIDVKLMRKSDVPDRMAFVSGGSYALVGWDVASTATVDLDPFFIDKYEVSNRDFEQFIRAGGYRRRDLWKQPFVRDGKTLPFEEAIALFRDTTGLAGPRSWAQGKYPQGLENHPVSSITWYEAAAYAEYAGKKLPTIFQWDKAARNGMRALMGNVYPWGISMVADVTRRANFREAGPMPVDSLPSGMSVWGVYHLAGNVTEWLRNAKGDGYATTGGAFDDPVYQFGNIGAYPASYQSAKVGFRCVRETGGGARDQGGFALDMRLRMPVLTPVNDAEFARIRRTYDYPNAPLEAKLVAREETSDWVREKITFRAAAGRTAIAYLYLPRGGKAPYQVIHFVPPGDVWRGRRPLPQVAERAAAGIVRGGRAFFSVVHEGFVERQRPERESALESTQDYINCAIELRRGLDYLTSRGDIDPAKIGFFGPSAGTAVGMLVTAVDSRYGAVMFQGLGLETRNERVPPEIDAVNFLPRITAPKYMIHGRYDEENPVITDAQPAFDLMRGEKRLELFEGGHIPQPEWVLPRLAAFFDKCFGPVTQ